MREFRRLSVLPFAMTVAALAGSATTADRFWAEPAGGTFGTGLWVGFNGEFFSEVPPPTDQDTAIFDIARLEVPRFYEYTIDFDADASVLGLQARDRVTFDLDPRSLSIGAGGLIIGGDSFGGDLTINGGSVESQGPIVIGDQSGDPCSLSLRGSAALKSDSIVSIRPTGSLDAAGRIESTVSNAGTLSLRHGSAAFLTIAGGYTQQNTGDGNLTGGRLEIEIAGPAENNDILVVQGHASLGGTLVVRRLNGYSPQPGEIDSRAVIASSLSGRFDVVYFAPAFPDNRAMRIRYVEGPERENLGVRIGVTTLPPVPVFGGGDEGAAEVQGHPVSAITGDFNDDGFPDVAAAIPAEIAARGSSGLIAIILNLGTDSNGAWLGFGAPSYVFAGANPVDIAGGDLDENGSPDLAVVAKGGPGSPAGLRILLNDGNGVFTQFGAPADVFFDIGTDPRGVALGNFIPGSPGFLDVVVTSLDSEGLGQLVALPNSGTTVSRGNWGGFAGGSSSPTADEDPGPVRPGGLDNPKDIDDVVVIANPIGTVPDRTAEAYTNAGGLRGTSVFNPPSIITVGNSPRFIDFADIDNDGDTDFATSDRDSGTVSLVINELNTVSDRGAPDPDFVVQALPVAQLPGPIAFLDIDGDTDSDIAVITQDDLNEGRVVRVLRNDTPFGGGQIVFALASDLGASVNPEYVLPGDVDGDGDVDVIAFTDPPDNDRQEATAFVNAKCAADLDGSGEIDTKDLCMLLMRFGQTVDPASLGELSGDTQINTEDLVLLLVRFGRICR